MQTERIRWTSIACDLLLLAAISLTAQAAHFTWKQGRAVNCADAFQYRDNAEALLAGDRTPDFSFRKPGYSLVLVASMTLLGSMGWGVVVLQYGMFALLPLGAYGMGRMLHSRAVAWLAALLTTARLFDEVWAERIMSEATYAVLLTFGLLALCAAAKGSRPVRWAWLGGTLLALGWLVRSVASIPAIAAALVLLVVHRKQPRMACATMAALSLPFAGAVLVESAANWRYLGRFQPGTGTKGTLSLLRATHLLGQPLPATQEGAVLRDLLPERDGEETHWPNQLDTWVARHRAIHDRAMSEWELDRLAGMVAGQIVAERPMVNLRRGTEIFVRHLLRSGDGRPLASDADAEATVIKPASAANDPHFPGNWYAYWALPNRAPQDAAALAERMRVEAQTKAPFGADGIWQRLRYWSRTPPVSDTIAALDRVGSIWPGFALVLMAALGLNRRACALLAVAMVLEALAYSVFASTDDSLQRFQFVWIALDTTLAAAVFAPVLRAVELHRLRWSLPGQGLPSSRLRAGSPA